MKWAAYAPAYFRSVAEDIMVTKEPFFQDGIEVRKTALN